MKKLPFIVFAAMASTVALAQLDTHDPTGVFATPIDQAVYDAAAKTVLPTQELTALFPAFRLINCDYGKERGVAMIFPPSNPHYRDAYLKVLSAGTLIKINRYDQKGKLLDPVYREITAETVKQKNMNRIEDVIIPLGTDSAYGQKNVTQRVDVTFLIKYTLEGHTPKQLTDKWQPVHFTLAPWPTYR